MDLGISGKRALVLAASRGLGLGIANALTAEGVHVLICGRTEEKLKANVEAIRAAGGKADYVVTDIADAHFVDQMLHAVHHTLGGIDILVNNTGGPTPGTVEDMDAEKLYNFFQSMVVRPSRSVRSLCAFSSGLPGLSSISSDSDIVAAGETMS